MKLATYQSSIPPPPPPPPLLQRKKRRGKGLAVAAAVLIAIVVIASLVYSGLIPWSPRPSAQAPGNVVVASMNQTKVIAQSVDFGGGVIEVTNSSSPLDKLRIDVPQAATVENITFEVSYSDIVDVEGLPQNASVASKLITIEAFGSEDWKVLDIPALVTLPYDPSLVVEGGVVRFYYYDKANKVIEPAGFLWEDTDKHTVSFYTRSFSDYFAILELAAQLMLCLPANSGFLPATDGWFIPNKGSYISPDGNCYGMSYYAQWYYEWKGRTGADTKLYEKYREGNPNEWRDDATAIQLVTRAQMQADEIHAAPLITRDPTVGNKWGSLLVAATLLHGLLTTNCPQILHLGRRLNNGKMDPNMHAILVYSFTPDFNGDSGHFNVYDPNYPATTPETDARQIPFSYANGFTRLYTSAGIDFNTFWALTLPVFFWKRSFDTLYGMAEKKFKDDTIFPTVKLTDSTTTPSGTTPEDATGDGIRDTSAATVTISGTITGGKKPIARTLVYVSGRKETVEVVDGQFSKKFDLYQGDNDIVVLATDEDTRSNWAGYLHDIIRCNATKVFLCIELNWKRANCDLDLHVLEPTIDGVEGRHIYYQNKGWVYGETGLLYPCLDVDDTDGYGPEMYRGFADNTLPNYNGPGGQAPNKSLYGTYQVKVQYYADHDTDEEQTQKVPWEVKVSMIAFTDLRTGYEHRKTMEMYGELDVAETSGTDNFSSTGASWSDVLSIPFPAPNPTDYGVPPPPQNSFPK